jgi:hypothetical protein
MRPLSTAELLDAWERGLALPPQLRTLALLDAADPGEAPGTLSIGLRDRHLLQLRVWAFGRQLPSVARCPHCRERVEWAVDAAMLLGDGAPDPPPAELSVDVDGRTIRFRLPNSLDLAAAASCGDVDDARRVLAERCVTSAAPSESAETAASIADVMAARMADADPGAACEFGLTCPACGHTWGVLLDIASFFWTEIDAWAQRTLKDVHTLASAYGWSEAAILHMGPARRQIYLDLVGA